MAHHSDARQRSSTVVVITLLLAHSVTLTSLGAEAAVGVTVLDAASGGPLIGATFTVDDAARPAATGIDGRWDRDSRSFRDSAFTSREC